MTNTANALSTGPTRRQATRLCGQVEAISIVTGELKRELLALPRSSLLYARPGPPSQLFPEKNMPIDVLADAIALSQAANVLLRSLGHMPTEDDPGPTLG